MSKLKFLYIGLFIGEIASMMTSSAGHVSAIENQPLQLALEAHANAQFEDLGLKKALFCGSSGALVHPVAVLRLDT